MRTANPIPAAANYTVFRNNTAKDIQIAVISEFSGTWDIGLAGIEIVEKYDGTMVLVK